MLQSNASIECFNRMLQSNASIGFSNRPLQSNDIRWAWMETHEWRFRIDSIKQRNSIKIKSRPIASACNRGALCIGILNNLFMNSVAFKCIRQFWIGPAIDWRLFVRFESVALNRRLWIGRSKLADLNWRRSELKKIWGSEIWRLWNS